MANFGNNHKFHKDNNRFNNRDAQQNQAPINNFIRADKVLVIDDEGNNLGEMDKNAAVDLAKSKGFDLVAVGASANPPVCRIMDYAKFLYEQKKKLKKSKLTGKLKEMKEFRFSPVIEEHDMTTKVRRAKEFLDKGHNVRISMLRRGRQSKDQAKEVFTNLLTNFVDYSTIEPEPKEEGKKIFITYKSDGKTKNK